MKPSAVFGLALATAILWKCYSSPETIEHPPGVLISQAPVQEKAQIRNDSWKVGNLVYRNRAHFGLSARVLAYKWYHYDETAIFSPLDLALGWGPMSDSSVLEHINIKQRARFYTWSAKTLPISTKDINIHSANMHLIPATESIRNQFESIRVGSIVQIKGKLVEINSLEGRRWKSSITRKDTGGGACEIIWVESIVVVN